MTIPMNIKDREYQKFTELDGETAVRVKGAIDVSMGEPGFGTPSTGFPKQVTVTTSSTELFASNLSRRYAHIFNNSNSPIYIQYNDVAVVGKGVRIPKNAFYTISGNELWLGTVNAISTSGSVDVDVMEA